MDKRNRVSDRPIILFAVLAWIITAIQLVLLVESGVANGYELNIYEKISKPCWVLFAVSTVIHTSMVITQFIAPRPKTHFAYLGIAGIAVNTLLIIALPLFRNYYSFRGDFSSHITTSQEIISSLNISRNNFYPALFGLIHVMHTLTGIDVISLWYFGGIASYVLGIGFAFIIGERLFKETRYSLWLGLAAAIPVAGGYLSPMTPASVSVHFLPLLFYLYITSRKPGATAHKFLLIILAILYPFLHPLTAMMGVVWLLVIEISFGIINRKLLHQPTKITLVSSAILGITWFMWFSSFSVLQSQVRSVANWFLGEASNQLSRLTTLVDRSGFSIAESIWLIFKQENGIILFTVIALLGIAYFLYLSIRVHRLNETVQTLFAILFLLLISIFSIVFGLIGPFEGLDFYRFSRFIVPWSTIGLIAIAFLLRTSSRRKLPGLAIVATLFSSVLIFLGYLAVYPSPFNFQPNDQVTVQEIKCMQWLGQHEKDGNGVRGIWGTYRLAVVALGYSRAQALPGSLSSFPNHFGYDIHQFIFENYPEPFYLVITNFDKYTVLDLWAQAGKFSSSDFLELTRDPTISLLYSNGECEIWFTQNRQ